MLSVYAREPRTWREEEVEALVALAANASAALSNAELYQRVALEREQSVAILANIADGIVAVDRDGHVVLWNRAAEEITGVPGVGGARPHAGAGAAARARVGRQAATNRLVSIPRGGEEVWLSLTEAVMRDPSGAVAGRIFAFRDISAEQVVEQMKSDFVSTVSVELRTPLTSIYGFAQTLLREDVAFGETERRTFLEYIARESERLTTIVDALLNVARLDTGDLAGHARADRRRDGRRRRGRRARRPRRTATATGSSPRSRRRRCGARPTPTSCARCSTSSSRTRSSTRPTAARSPCRRARTTETVELASPTRASACPPSERERIFSKFYRGGRRAGPRHGARALHRAAGSSREMGGRMWVDSREGRGSRFAFELPAGGRSV